MRIITAILVYLVWISVSYSQCTPGGVVCDQTNPGTSINSSAVGEVICITSDPGGNINMSITHDDVSVYVCVDGLVFNGFSVDDNFYFETNTTGTTDISSINVNRPNSSFVSNGGGRLRVFGANINQGPINFESTNESDTRLQFSINTAHQVNIEVDTNSSFRINSNVTISDGNINIRKGGSLGVTGYFHGNGTDVRIVNYDSVYVGGEFYVQGANAFQNACGEGVLEVGGDFRLNSNSSLINEGTIRATTTRINSSAGPISMGTGSNFIILGSIDAQNTEDVFEFTGVPGECAQVEFGSIGNWNFDLTADSEIHYCGPAGSSRPGDATISCVCNSTPIYCDPLVPVKFGYMKAYKSLEGNRVSWATLEEVNNSHFIVERSTDGVTFNAVGVVQGSGNTNYLVAYEFLDKEVSSGGVVYYRVKQVDFDGKYEYSQLVSVTQDALQLVQVLSNPVEAGEGISLLLFQEGKYTVKLVDAVGRNYVEEYFEVKGMQQVDLKLDVNLFTGIYHLIVASDKQSQVVKLMVH